MNDFIRDFQSHLADRDCAERTLRGYLSDLLQFADWFEQVNGEALRPERITPSDVKRYKDFLLNTQRRAASTINRRLAALSAFAKWAQQAGLIHSDPTVYVKSVKQVRRAPKWLNKSEQFALQRAIEKDLQVSRLRYPKRFTTRRRDASIALFLLNTGLRVGELIAMCLGDVQLSDRKGNVRVQNGKGRKQRQVPLNAEARAAIQDWFAVRPETDNDQVWVGVEGQSEGLSARSVQRILERYATQAGLETLTPHTCRHTVAKNLLDSGVGLEKVAALLGHESISTTMIYVTPSAHDLEQAVGALEKC